MASNTIALSLILGVGVSLIIWFYQHLLLTTVMRDVPVWEGAELQHGFFGGRRRCDLRVWLSVCRRGSSHPATFAVA